MARRQKRKKDLFGQKAKLDQIKAFNPVLEVSIDLPRKNVMEAEPSGMQEVRPLVSEENLLFINAMGGVKRLPARKKIVDRPVNPKVRPAHPANSEDLEVLAHLNDLVSGLAPMDITYSEEYMEGSVRGFDRNLMDRLKKGLFPIQDHVDLHGLTQQEAEARVHDFLIRSHRSGFRCVLVVHGRGLNSENQTPVLKEKLPVWLNRGPVRKIVLAFSTSQPYDGGAGAVYVLLRRR